MTAKRISGGTVHKLPADLHEALLGAPVALAAWEDISPLARNEWICWVETTKKESTRHQHIARAIEELSDGGRRPCCWYGCIHRTDKAISPSVRGILQKRQSKKNSAALRVKA